MPVAHLGTTLAIAALAAFSVYRRVRRNIGRQPFRPRRLILRIVIFAVICILVTALAPLPHYGPAAMAGGCLAGVALGLFGLRHTDFEFTPQGNWYTPHLYIGLLVIALLVGRLFYRGLQLYAMTDATTITGHAAPPVFGSPLTLGILFLTAGYHVAYSAALLQRLRSVTAVAPAA